VKVHDMVHRARSDSRFGHLQTYFDWFEQSIAGRSDEPGSAQRSADDVPDYKNALDALANDDVNVVGVIFD
jgi:hypothetical protein